MINYTFISLAAVQIIVSEKDKMIQIFSVDLTFHLNLAHVQSLILSLYIPKKNLTNTEWR